ncbi:MAG: sigma-70 family RNA polymerase sigma factor [Bradymonadales bacterium]|nr:sigma-70 family RNA polymerase sigma factor [Bradymonadales bacterium]
MVRQIDNFSSLPARDADLVGRLLSGDEKTFTLLVDRYHHALHRLARVYVGDSHLAEEVVQETWLAVIKGLPAFEGRSSLKTWIFRILTNRAKSRGVREGRTIPFSTLAMDADEGERWLDTNRFRSDGSFQMAPRAWEPDTPEQMVLNRETRVFVERVIDRLPPKQKAVITLRDIEGWPSDEVCDLLEISETYQRVLLHRGRSRVRAEFDRYLEGN